MLALRRWKSDIVLAVHEVSLHDEGPNNNVTTSAFLESSATPPACFEGAMSKRGDRVKLTDRAAIGLNNTLHPGRFDWRDRRGVVENISKTDRMPLCFGMAAARLTRCPWPASSPNQQNL